jgi:ATP-binding protein involved in chromosome partitioning
MKHVISVASGKGGVGKSTVAVNLAVSLANQGHSVALIDADLYGPSVPTLFGGGEIRIDHEQKLIPPLKYGVKYISIGFFLPNPDSPVIWRGPMFSKALQQLFFDVKWGSVDICVVDMPPGTGDASISLSQMQNIKLSGSVVITTPQEVALVDVRKAISMLRRVEIPILGIVENMSSLTLDSGEVLDIFGSGGGRALCNDYGIELLSQIPLNTAICKAGDLGVPVAASNETSTRKIKELFDELASKVYARINNQKTEAVAIVS